MTIIRTTTERPLLLASASPRRRQIISHLGLPFSVAVAPGDEDKAQEHYQGPIDGLAQWTATYKALMMLTLPESASSLIITADTTVILDDQVPLQHHQTNRKERENPTHPLIPTNPHNSNGKTPKTSNSSVLGKPRDAAHARELLLTLRGRWHRVTTGVVVSTLINGQITAHGKSCTTPVLMRTYSEEEIDAYIATGDPMDKAGAYGIQHPQFQPTEQIDGCYLNVVGLPLCILVDLLAEFGIQPAIDTSVDDLCARIETEL